MPSVDLELIFVRAKDELIGQLAFLLWEAKYTTRDLCLQGLTTEWPVGDHGHGV